MAPEIYSHWIGQLSYADGLSIQNLKEQEVRQDRRKIVVIGQEYSPTITLGVRGCADRDLVVSKAQLDEAGVDVVFLRRGGQATLHAPGQLVIYPTAHIRELGIGIKSYIEILEATTVRYLKGLGISGKRTGVGPGIYTAKGKIAFLGMQVSKGVVKHGLSINVSNSLEEFHMIRSCGRKNESFDSVCCYQKVDSLEVEFLSWFQCFKSYFEG